MKLTMLGTGNAAVTKIYNTCFLLEDEGRYLLTDGGGGNEILRRLEQVGLLPAELHDIFVTHRHIDHLLGILWLMRVILQGPDSDEPCRIYAHDEVTGLLQGMADSLLGKKIAGKIGSRLLLIPVADSETRTIIGHPVTFFDIASTKAKQFGYCLDMGGGRRLVCCGDEPCADRCRGYVQDADWLLHEAFCLQSEADLFHPYEKHHSTVADACRLAEELSVKNLVLYHTEDRNIENRRKLYTAEGIRYYHGRLLIPEDMESLEL